MVSQRVRNLPAAPIASGDYWPPIITLNTTLLISIRTRAAKPLSCTTLIQNPFHLAGETDPCFTLTWQGLGRFRAQRGKSCALS